MTAWIGIDTGGTFTDLILANVATGEFRHHKTPTTPDDPARGILQGLSELLADAGIAPGAVDFLCHGTTLATNAVLERKWARTGLVTTGGFRDVLALARQRRPNFFNLDVPKPTPPVPSELNCEVVERIAFNGEVLVPIDEDAVYKASECLRDAGCQTVAVCFLHAYANPEHERRAAEIISEVLPDAYVTTSSGVLAEFREYERFTTTVVNASLRPILDGYLARFEAGIAALGITYEPRIMQSNGGAVSPAIVRRMPVNTFFSGPAGGVIGGTAAGKAAGCDNVITLDIGGTSTDVALIKDASPGFRNVREMAGFPVRTRTLDIHTIGAGGGSIAWVDPGGLMKVGPASAGAVPGPAAYGQGGERPTVTDANVVLGRLSQEALLDGRMPIYPDRARAAIEEHLCGPLGLDLAQAAAGVIEIVNVNMVGAVRVISVERGEDPRRFTLMPFGGAGPLHACDVSQLLGMGKVLIAGRPGVLSASGLLQADAQGDFSRTLLVPAVPASIDEFNRGLAGLKADAAAWLQEETDGTDEAVRFYGGDFRYAGQNFELAVPLPGDNVDAAVLAKAVAEFHVTHENTYGYSMAERGVEVVNLRLTVRIRRSAPSAPVPEPVAGSTDDAIVASRGVWFANTGYVVTPVYRRELLPTDASLAGPAVVEQMDATTIVPPGTTLAVDRLGNLHLMLEADDATDQDS
ncbi:MAG: hydantoinase/oxoprolinase family protein [Hyphomicrobiaceae bacterium]